MTAMEPLCIIMGINPHELSKPERIILEVEIFAHICQEIIKEFKLESIVQYSIIKFEKENEMFDKNLAQVILNDILSTKDYTIQGIAHYTDTHEDIVHEVAVGINTSPSAHFLRRVIELHRTTRRDLYHAIMQKIVTKYLN